MLKRWGSLVSKLISFARQGNIRRSLHHLGTNPHGCVIFLTALASGNTVSSSTTDFFFDAYNRDEIAYGLEPSAALAAYLQQIPGGGPALDLGAGAGRDTLALAAAGYEVTSVDLSARGLDRIAERAEKMGLHENVNVQKTDVRGFTFKPNHYNAIIATTVLDHIPEADAADVWKSMCAGLAPSGFLYVQVHTTEDPGSGVAPGNTSDEPVSETAGAVVNYFPPNRLVAMAIDTTANLRVLRYEERLEWDYTHGEPHQHGKAILLAVRADFHPNWFGQPPAFPKQD